jgi:hypothetical protein
MNKNTVSIMQEAKIIAQNEAPLDTGNLRYNSIRAYKTPNGFRIVMLYTVAFYGAILNTPGDEAPQMHRGWWSNGVATSVGFYIDAVMNNKRSSVHIPTDQVSNFAPDNPARKKRFFNSMVADSARDAYISRINGGK